MAVGGPSECVEEVSVALQLRSPKSCIALNTLRRPIEAVPLSAFCKRGVVAWRRRELRSVAYEYGRSPKQVLSGAFQKLRRATSTKTLRRMSGRLAGPSQRDLNADEWRSVGEVALSVLRSRGKSL